MGPMSISSQGQEPFGELGLRSHEWARVRISDIGGQSEYAVLAGATVPDQVAVADARGRVGDLIGTYWASLLIAGPRFIDVVTDAGLTGCVFVPLQITGNPLIQDGALLQVSGRCGPIETPGLDQLIQLDTWDGKDFFIAENNGRVRLSPRALTVLRKARLRNVLVEPARVEFI